MIYLIEIESYGTLTAKFSIVGNYVDNDDYLQKMICSEQIEGIEILLSDGRKVKMKLNESHYNIDRNEIVEE